MMSHRTCPESPAQLLHVCQYCTRLIVQSISSAHISAYTGTTQTVLPGSYSKLSLVILCDEPHPLKLMHAKVFVEFNLAVCSQICRYKIPAKFSSHMVWPSRPSCSRVAVNEDTLTCCVSYLLVKFMSSEVHSDPYHLVHFLLELFC